MMTRINYYMNGKYQESETVRCDHRDWIKLFMDLARKAGEPIKQIGPSLQAMRWITILECQDGSSIKVEGL